MLLTLFQQNLAAASGAVSVSAAQTLDSVSQTATVSIPVAVSAAQTLASLSQSASVQAIIAATASQTLATVTQSANVSVPVSITAAQVLATISQVSTVSIPVAVSTSQSLADLSQAASVALASSGVSVSAAQTLAGVTQTANVHLVAVAASSADYDHGYWRTYKIKNAKRRAAERRRNADIQTWLAGLDAPPVVAKPVRIRPQPVFVAQVAPPSEILAAIPQQLTLELPPVAPRRSLAVERAISSYRSSRRPIVAEAVSAYYASQTESVVAYRRSKRPVIADAVTAYRRSKAA